MLDRFKLVTQITNNVHQITGRQASQLDLALRVWQQIAQDQDFKASLIGANLPFAVPTWEGDLGQVINIDHYKIDYTVVSCDGSQIYPDRHMGSNYYLINTGIVTVRYGQQSSVSLVSEPYFFADINEINVGITDYVDSKRHELEINDGFKAVLKELVIDDHQNLICPVVYLVDGSLIAWHLFGKGDYLREQFLPVYLNQLKLFHDQSIPLIGYTSLPNSADLINLIKIKHNHHDLFTDLVDSDFLEQVLLPGQFTNWFKSQVGAVKEYPVDLKIYFTYLNTGYEIARIEIPEFVFNNSEMLNLSMQVVLDQVIKGYGYPVALGEAHQQAVIKNADRHFFYQVINQVSDTTKQVHKISRKLRQKQVMNF